MKRYKRYTLPALLTLTILATLSFLIYGVVGASSIPGSRSPIPGHLIPALRGRTPLGATDGQQRLQLSISLNLADPAGLQALINAQNDKHSPLYHQYITPQQFTAHYAPSQASVDAVVSWLRSQGLTVQSVAANRLIIDAEGTVATVEKAFNVSIENFALKGHVVYAPTNEPSVPSSLAGLILNIGGLDNTSTPHRLGSLAPQKAQMPASGPGGGFTPLELHTVYDMTPLVGTDDGTGQTVALVELDGYKASDITTYLSEYGLGSAKFSNVLVDGASNTPGANADEVTLDMEIMSAIAPGASQKIYIGPNTFQGFLDVFDRIVTDDTAKVASNSWGNCEASFGTSGMQAYDTVFSAAAAQGQAFFSSSGDSGSADCSTSTSLAVDYPASDPFVVGVGGTTLNTTNAGAYLSESVWNNQDGSDGGGLSTFFGQPGYQTGPGVTNKFSNGKREVPDVSADADPQTGYSIFCTVGTLCTSPFPSGWTVFGGTSASTPLWAGVATDINELLKNEGKSSLGSASADLYRVFNTPQALTAYHDVTSGNNDNLGTNGGKYPATTGYDMASGIGTPDVWNLARDIAGDVPAVTPNLIYLITKPGATVAPQIVTIQNNSPNSYSWTLTGLQSWISADQTSGTIPGHSSTQFRLTITLGSSPQTLTTTLTVQDNDTNGFNPFTIPVAVVSANVSNTWYFAEGFTGTGFSEYLTLANPNSIDNTVTVQYLLQGASPITKQYTLLPISRTTLNINSEIGPNQNVSMIVTGTLPLIAERPMYFNFGGTIPGGSDVLGATSLSQNFDFGYLDTTANHHTYLTILNPDPTNTMDVQITYFSASGKSTVIDHSVPANSRGTVPLATEGLPAGTYSALVHLSLPGLVERPMYLKDATTGNTGAADVVGVANPLTNWDFAEGFVSSAFSERYILSNPGSQTATGTITFFLASGSPVTTPFTLNAGQQTIINVGSQGVSGNNSAHVSASQPILAERFMSFKFGTSIPGATDVLGAAAPSNLFYFAEGFTGTGFSEYLTIENPDPTNTATVQVIFLPANGHAATVRVYTIAPSSRFTLNTGTVMPGQSFSMIAESNVAIVAERPMYFNFSGGRTGGSDVVGYQP
ncbi:MAG TPA: S53 family peptidase [Ktedonobacterales bacterium]|nr:S53 family peptidase [Ktedonobacterales bacterium]